MKDIVREYQEQFRRHRIQLRRYTALLLALAMVTTLFVNWQLHSDGIAKTAEYLCGKEEHEHTAQCYPQVLVCGYEEGEPEDWTVSQPDSSTPIDESFGVDADTASDAAALSAEPEYIFVPHEHTADCYQEVTTEVPVLTCVEEEHEHTDDCFDPEDGSLICDKFEHTHDDSCYTIEYETEEELVCGYEEGELVEELNPDYNPVAMFEAPVAAKPVVVEPVAEGPVHHHTDACYAPDYTADPICGMEEHHHDVNCLSDPLDSVEDESDWLAQTDTTLTGVWTDDLLSVAKSQLDYEQSEKNFRLDTDDGETLRYYTRYGQWYGSPYGPWDVTFLSYCLNYAGIPESAIPQVSGAQTLHSQLRGTEYMGDFAGDLPIDAVMPGDIVFYTTSTKVVVAVEDSQTAVSDDSPDADTALLSMDTAASQPQTEETTVTDTTVGIVSDVDYDAGTLAVISGNVDGKVAEVTLNASQVTSLVSVATAQALNEDGAAEQPDNTGMNGSSYITDSDFQVKKGIEYVSSTQFNLSESVRGMLLFENISLSDIVNAGNCVYYDLPKQIKASSDLNGKLFDKDTEQQAGTYSFVENADGSYRLVLHYDEDYLNAHKGPNATVKSQVEFAFNWNEEYINTSGENEINFGDKKFTITINDDTPEPPTKSQFKLSKNASELSYEGKDAYITYTVKLTVNEVANAPLVLEDVLANPNNVLFKYNGDPKISSTSGSAPDITWKEGDSGNSRTFTIGKDGETINPGEYEITYKVKCENFGQQALQGDVQNSVKIKDHDDVKPQSKKTSVNTSLINKGNSSSGDSGIKWTIDINNGDALQYLNNETFTDTIPKDLTLNQGSLTIKRTDATGKSVDVVKNGKLTDNAAGETLTIGEDGKITCKLADGFYTYKITYTTTADESKLPLDGQTFTNTGEVDGDSGKGSSSSSKTLYPSSLSKEAYGTTPEIDSSTNTVTLHWKSTINVNGSLNGYHYYDYSSFNWRPGSNGTYDNYKAQKMLLDTVKVYDSKDTEITEKLKNAISAYEYGKKDPAGDDLGLFQIDFGELNITGPVTILYDTQVDMSTIPPDSDRDIINTCYITNADGIASPEESASQKLSTKDTSKHYLTKSVKSSSDLQVGQKLSWSVGLNKDGGLPYTKGESIKITDTLPYGMLLDESSIRMDFNGLNHYGVSPILDKDYFIEIGEVIDENGHKRTTLTVTLTEEAYLLSNGTVQKQIFLYYDTMLDPDKVNELFGNGSALDQATAAATFKNDATLDYAGYQESTSAETKIELNVLGKEGSYNDITGTLSYTVKVNPTGADLSGGGSNASDTLLLFDKLNTGKLGEAKRITLQSISVFSATLENGELKEDEFLYDLALADSSCSEKHAENHNVGEYGYKIDRSKDIHVWTKIPNRTPLILIFNYKIDTNNLADGTYDLSNKVQINGKWEYTEKTTDANHSSSGSVQVDQKADRLTIVKYADGITDTLSGAKFKLEYYDGKDWLPYSFTDDSGNTTSEFITGSNGQCTVDGLQRGVVYRILETKAPDGFIQPASDAYHYFCIESLDNDWQLPTVPGVNTIDVRKPNDTSFQTFTYYCKNVRDETYVTPGSLKVTKAWNENGSVITDKTKLDQMTPVTVTLYKYIIPTYTVTLVNPTTGASSSRSFAKGTTLSVAGQQNDFSGDGVSYDSSSGKWYISVQQDLKINTTWYPDGVWAYTTPSYSTDEDGELTLVDTQTLSSKNNWSYTWSDLTNDSSVLYYKVVETTVDGYTTSYTVGGNETGDCPEIKLTSDSSALVTITNTAESSGGYELPSTGGAGTTPYTAVGGAIALAALVCGLCQKRRRERRAHN